MYEATVEIYSDTPNHAIMRHPGRQFPGSLVQGDTLYSLCVMADEACAKTNRSMDEYHPLNKLRNALWDRLNHYKKTLNEHDIPLPFSEQR